MLTTTLRATAATLLAAIALTACGGGGLPDDPGQAAPQAVGARFEQPYAFSLGLQISEEGIAAARAEDPSSVVILNAIAAGSISGASNGTWTTLTVSAMNTDWAELRANREDGAVYLRFDSPRALAMAGVPAPSVEDLRPGIEESGLPPATVDQVVGIATALIDGDWIGLEGFTQARVLAIQRKAAALAGPGFAGKVEPSAQATASERASELGLTDGSTFADRYLTFSDGVVEQENERRFEATLRTTVLLDALRELVADAFPDGGGPAAMFGMFFDQLGEVPDISGLSMTAVEGTLTEAAIDLADVVRSAEPGADVPFGSGDFRVVVDFGDPTGEETFAAPEGAAVITADDAERAIDDLSTLDA